MSGGIAGFDRIETLSNEYIPVELVEYLNKKLKFYQTAIQDHWVETNDSKLDFIRRKAQNTFKIKKIHTQTNVRFVPQVINATAGELVFDEGSEKFKNPKIYSNDLGKIINAIRNDLDYISILNQSFQKIYQGPITITDEETDNSKNESTFKASFSQQPLAHQTIEYEGKKKNGKRIFCKNMLEAFLPVVFKNFEDNMQRMAKEGNESQNKKIKQESKNQQYQREQEAQNKLLEESKKGNFGNKQGNFLHITLAN